ncbi:MAG: hypothetical protein K0M73_00480 [Hydrogenophaga sp.]|nr:hypothetical protein [Hydrogenophaga sp.]
MTGFLQRLAQRATGSARTVRAAPGARFAPEPLGHGTPMQQDAPAPESRTPFEPASSTTATPPGASPGGFPAPVLSPADARRQRAAGPPLRGQTGATASTPAPLLAPADEAAAPASAWAPRAIASMSTPRPPHPVDEAPAARSANPAPSETAAPRPDATPANASAPAWPPIKPLLAPTIRVRWPASAALPPLAHQPGRGGPADTTTEVHVSIGRIEVTAIHEPAAPAQRAAARRKAPVSLDEYLARRQAGHS